MNPRRQRDRVHAREARAGLLSRGLWREVLLAAALAASTGCTGGAIPLASLQGGGIETTVAVTATGSEFDPRDIEARRGDTLLLKVTNVSGTAQSITVRAPDGQIVASRPLPPAETVEVAVPLGQVGHYEFYGGESAPVGSPMRGQITSFDESAIPGPKPMK